MRAYRAQFRDTVALPPAPEESPSFFKPCVSPGAREADKIAGGSVLTAAWARRIAINIARLPGLLGKGERAD
jgi:hypothetical protein